jgi:CubicO group peptidase (beta-lactamase class C family)
MRLMAIIAAVAGCSGGSTRTTKPAATPDPWRAAIAAQVAPYLDAEIVTGVAIGVVDGDRARVYGFGRTGNSDSAPTGDTLFELGGVTAVYTAVLLADAIERGAVAADAPLAQLLPVGASAPVGGDVAITVEHLASHRSGLPRLPGAIAARGPSANPHADYGEDALFRDLAAARLLAVPGEHFTYSTFGIGVLGHVLARHLGAATSRGMKRSAGATAYDAALRERVLVPLGLRATSQAVPAGAGRRHAVGHDDDGKPVPFWTWSALAGAGALRSTASDQLAFVRANLAAADETSKAPLAAALRRSHQSIATVDDQQVALGWLIDADGRRWHSGSTGGFHAFIGFDPQRDHGVVVLASTSSTMIDRLARALFAVLAGERPPPIAFPSPSVLAPLAGRYRIAGDASTMTVTLDGKRLRLQVEGEPARRLVPLSATEFLIEAFQAVVVFDGDHVVVALPGGRVEATRVAD